MKNSITHILRKRLLEVERLKGGVADGKTIEDIADKHNVSLSQLKQELARGVKEEMEHTNNRNIAKEIAMDHLYKDPKYYTKLKRCKIDENEIAVVGDVPAMKYVIKIKGRPAGIITINEAVPELGDNTAEIVDVKMNEGYNDLDSTLKAIRHIWTILPELEKLVTTITPENQVIWEKAGFQRLNDTFWFASRGH